MEDSYFEIPRHAVAVIGGACAGAEAAEIFAKAGIYTVVIDQNQRPFGKIEDGLPRWHGRQRSREYGKIADKLSTDGIDFMPTTKIGRDLDFETLRSWGFSAVVLACGAWSDRKLGAEGADAADGKGLIYQNPFIYWFNHHEEASFDGEQFDLVDGAVVVGGGLASIDCVKALNLEMAAKKLRERGIECDVLHMEHKGIKDILAGHGITWEELGLEGCTLVYRRSPGEMPLVQYKDGADAASKEKTNLLRAKLMGNVQDKFFVNGSFNSVPKRILFDDDGNMSGLEVIGTRTEGRKVIEIEGSERVLPTTLILSSIGSVPEPIPGLPLRGEFYEYDDWDMGVVKDMTGVFGVGNVVTGQGNIVISRKHSKKVADSVVADYLGVGDGTSEEFVPSAVEGAAAETAEAVKEHLNGQEKLSVEKLGEIHEKIAAWQHYMGYETDFKSWIELVTPPDRI